ncbi:alpha/beta hydrolase [Runella rosea]|uniref:Alpha/beta hydrolase n=2 Tax=Runella rosea TaxID=2259595 RepID=A0A344TED3_9BACT|nr:alpha/beta hydrolase [Runella rosea]
MKISKKNWFRLVWFSLVGTFTLWNWLSYQTRNLPANTLTSTAQTTVTVTKQLISFSPMTKRKTVLLFFPGALVEPSAYAPIARHAADAGFESHIIKMPWRMATRGYQQIKTLFSLTDTTKRYVLAGHSQGGKMAAQFAYENKNVLAGLILMGTSHPRDIDLSSFILPVVKLYATNDGLASLPEVFENKGKLPSNTQWVGIKGGNHAQFGYYGSQLGDDNATITREVQQSIINQTVIGFLKIIENK